MEITQDLVKNLFDYKDGCLFHKKVRGGVSPAKMKVGSESKGYLKTSIYRKQMLVHRLIFLWHYGYLPKIVDHINGNTLDNRIENLRIATPTQNVQNRKVGINSKTNILGVTWHTRDKRWESKIIVNGKKVFLGYYKDIFSAAIVRKQAEDQYFGNYVRKI